MDVVTFVFLFGVVLIGVTLVLALYFAKKDDEEKKREEEKKVPTESASTPADPKEQSAEKNPPVLAKDISKDENKKNPDADRDAIKREILEELRSQGLRPARIRFTARQKGAIALFLLQTASYAGSLVQVGVGAISALAYSIGASVFMVIGAILLLTEKKEGN